MSAFMCFLSTLPIFFLFLLHKGSNLSLFTPDLVHLQIPTRKGESFVDLFSFSGHLNGDTFTTLVLKTDSVSCLTRWVSPPTIALLCGFLLK